MVEVGVPKASEEDVKTFVKTSGMTKVDLEPLLGISRTSKGKSLTRWETYGPPPSASLLMAYMARYGFDLAKEIAEGGKIDLTIDSSRFPTLHEELTGTAAP